MRRAFGGAAHARGPHVGARIAEAHRLSHPAVERARLESVLQAIRSNGYGTDNGEYLVDSVCLAVPVRDARGRVCAAIAVHGPAPRMTLKKGVAFVPAMREAAAALADLWFDGADCPSAAPAHRRTNSKREDHARPIGA